MMIKSNLLNSCFIRGLVLVFVVSLRLTAMAQAPNSQPVSPSPQVSSENRIASLIKTWPEPGSPMELLPKIEVQPLTDEDMRMAFAAFYAKQTPQPTWEHIKQKVCLTKFWQKKPMNDENPFMINAYDGRHGFIKLNGYVAEAKPGGGSKLGSNEGVGEGQLDGSNMMPIHGKLLANSRVRYVGLELRKIFEKNCSVLDSKCKIYNAEAYLHWVGFMDVDGKSTEGPREDLRNVYIEDRCYKNEFKTQLFYHRFQPNIFERIVRFFFSLS